MTQSAALNVALVTGAAGGIGAELVAELARRGWRVVATDVSLAVLETAATRHGWPSERVEPDALDVRDAAGWAKLVRTTVERHGRLDLLCNVAGVLRPGLVHDASAADIDFHVDVNAKGLMYGTQAAAAVMVRQGRGQIVNVASMAALAAVPGIALYTASKWAVRGFSLAVAQELAPRGVRVSVVCPDAVQTPMLDLQLDYREAALTFSGPRALTVDEVVRAVLEQAIERGRLEVIVPWRRGLLAKLTSFFPNLARRMVPGLTAKGLKRQAAARARFDCGGAKSGVPSPWPSSGDQPSRQRN